MCGHSEWKIITNGDGLAYYTDHESVNRKRGQKDTTDSGSLLLRLPIYSGFDGPIVYDKADAGARIANEQAR